MHLKTGVTPIVLLAFCFAVEAWDGSLLLNSFNSDREGWQAYDYNGGVAGGGNVFYPLNWEKSGGVNGGAVWAGSHEIKYSGPQFDCFNHLS
jgi:hypothetical protein